MNNSEKHKATHQGGILTRSKVLAGGVALSASLLLSGCGNGIPEEAQTDYKMGKEVLISKSEGFEFYKWEPAGSPRQLYLVKYHPESQNDGKNISKQTPQKIGENNGLELYKWEADGAGSDLYIVKGSNDISTNWSETRLVGKVSTTYNYTVSYQNSGKNMSVGEAQSNSDKAIQTWIKLTPEEQESLGLPRKDIPRVATLISLTKEQREDLGLTQEYNELIAKIKK